MKNLLAAVLLLVAQCVATAQDKISPLARHGSGFYVVVFQPGSDMRSARRLIRASGLDLLEHPDLLPNHLLAAGPSAKLEGLAAHAEVQHVIPASFDLVARNRVMSCAGGISSGGMAADYVEMGTGWPKNATGGVALQYDFQSLTNKLDANTAQSAIERALAEWQKYANITFAPGGGANTANTITILFASGAHGDAYPFTSTSILAHTFYPAPPNPEPIAGDMHFNADVAWNVGADVDLFSVALHEAGHALGLGHTDQPGAVMYPYYRMATGLTSDDIAGIQSLYGARGSGTATGTGTSGGSGSTGSGNGGTGTGTGTGGTPPSTPPPSNPPSAGGTTPPNLTIVVPGSTIVWTSSAALPVSGTAGDRTGLASVTWSTSNGDAGTAVGTTSWSAVVPLLVGNNTVTIRAYDVAGNSAWRSLTAVRQ